MTGRARSWCLFYEEYHRGNRHSYLWRTHFIGGGSRKGAERLSARHKLPFPVLVDPDRAVYRRYGLDKVLIALQCSGTFLIDKQDIVRYIHQVTNPQASVEKEELMREVEQLSREETKI